MKIAFLAIKNPCRGGGIEKYTSELGPRLVDRGHEVTVYSMKHYGETPRYLRGMRVIPVFALKTASLQKMTASFSASMHALFCESYDIVHLHSVASGAFAGLHNLRNSRPILQMHGIEWQRDRWGKAGSMVLRKLEKIAVGGAMAITAVSKKQCDYLQAEYGCLAEYIPTATDIPARRGPRRILEMDLEPSKYILFASRLVKEKGADLLISAFRTVKTDMKLVIAGGSNGDVAYRKTLTRLADGDKRIVFAGHVEGPLLEELFSNAYVYVQPSTIEGLSIALLEAMSHGRCCLASDIPENVEALGDTGYTFKSTCAEDLAEKLHGLVGCAVKVRRGAQAVERIRDKYSWQAVTEKMEAFYERVLATPAGAEVHTRCQTTESTESGQLFPGELAADQRPRGM